MMPSRRRHSCCEADGGPLELTGRDRFGVARILQRQGLESTVDRLLASFDDRHQLGFGVGAEQVRDRLGVEGRQLGQDTLRDHEDLEAVGKALRQHLLPAEPTMQPKSDTEPAVGPRDLREPLLVTCDTIVAHGIDQPVGTGGHHGHHSPRQGLLLEQIEVELLLARAQGDQADLDPLVEIERELGRH